MAITRTQYKHAYVSYAATLDSAVSLDEVILVGFSNAFADDLSGWTCSDSLGNTYSLVAYRSTSAGWPTNVAIFKCKVTNTGTPTITVDTGGSYTDEGLTAAVYSGANDAIEDSGSDANTNPLSVTLTLSGAGMIFAWYGNEMGEDVVSRNNLTDIYTDTSHDDSAAENLSVSAGSIAVGFDSGGSNQQDNAMVAVALLEASSGPSIPLIPNEMKGRFKNMSGAFSN